MEMATKMNSPTDRSIMQRGGSGEAQAAKVANRQRFKAQTITIDDNWQVVRSDELNWEIQFKGRFWGYYGSFLDALKSLPATLLSSEAKNSLADIQQRQKAICERITKALNLKMAT